MKNISPLKTRALAATGIAAMAMLPLAAFAQSSGPLALNLYGNMDGNATVATPPASADANANAQVSASGSAQTSTGTAGSGTVVVSPKGRANADKEIDRRVLNLNALILRIGSMKNVSADEKTTLAATLNSEVSTLSSLRTKIDSDNATDLKTDAQSITKDYRVYALVIPQAHIASAADRIGTVASLMQSLSVKLQTRITAAQTAGKNVSAAQSAYTDMQAKTADAKTQAAAAVTETASLKPDQGSASVQASNTAALKDAAAKIKTANADLRAARADINTILKTVKGVGAAASATTTVSAQ
jgi:hypothetical protein